MKNEINEDIKKNFKGVYSSDSLTKYVNFEKILKTNKSPYLFLILNTRRINKPGVHWWSFLNIDPKNELLLFDSEGFEGFEFFFISNDRAIVDKVMYNLNSFNKKDNKINLISVEFPPSANQKLKESEINALADTAQDLFHVLTEFANFNKVKNEIKLILVDDKLQKIYTDTCGKFQLYFYKNLFDPVKNSKILDHEHLTKRTIETLLNEIYTTDKDENERRVENFAKQSNL